MEQRQLLKENDIVSGSRVALCEDRRFLYHGSSRVIHQHLKSMQRLSGGNHIVQKAYALSADFVSVHAVQVQMRSPAVVMECTEAETYVFI